MATFNVVRKKTIKIHPGLKYQFDYWMLLALAGLVVIGMLMVYSSTFDYGLLFKEDPTYYFKRQFVALIGGLFVAALVIQVDYHFFRRISVPFLVTTLTGLLVVLFIGQTIFGAKRGIVAGSFQPSEVAKLATIFYISHWLSSKGDRIKMLTYGLIPFSAITGIVVALIVLQPDLSTAGLVALISFTLFFVAGADWRQFAVSGLIGSGVFLILITTLPHAAARVSDYRKALVDPTTAGWQIQQSLVALGRGGLFGVGLGESKQKFGPLPAAHTDGVFAILGEELGLMGSLLLVGLFVMLVWRGMRAARLARDSYGALLAMGITCWLGYQAIINIAVITAVIPFTGIPLPFVSYGGSSLFSSVVGAGVLLSISRDAAIHSRPQAFPARKTSTVGQQTAVVQGNAR